MRFEVIEMLRPLVGDISYRMYYRKRREAIDALSLVMCGYTSKDSLEDLERVSPQRILNVVHRATTPKLMAVVAL